MKIPKKATNLDVMVAAAQFILERTEQRTQAGAEGPDPQMVEKIRFRNRNEAMFAIYQLVQRNQREMEQQALAQFGVIGNA